MVPRRLRIVSEDRRKQHMAPIVWASKWPHGYQITKHCGLMGVVVYQESILATWAANTKKTGGEHICCNVIGYRESRFLAEDSRQHMVWPGVDGDHMCKNGTLHQECWPHHALMSVLCVLATFAALGRLTTWSPTLTSVAVWQCVSHPVWQCASHPHLPHCLCHT